MANGAVRKVKATMRDICPAQGFVLFLLGPIAFCWFAAWVFGIPFLPILAQGLVMGPLLAFGLLGAMVVMRIIERPARLGEALRRLRG